VGLDHVIADYRRSRPRSNRQTVIGGIRIEGDEDLLDLAASVG
jgi:hypothetical protein